MNLTDDLPHTVQLVHGTVPVEHRRELYHDRTGLFQQFFFQCQDIRRAVADEHRLASLFVAACRIEEDYRRMSKLMEVFRTVRIDDLNVFQAEGMEVMARRLTECFLPFYIDGPFKATCHEREVDPEAACEVAEKPPQVPPGEGMWRHGHGRIMG